VTCSRRILRSRISTSNVLRLTAEDEAVDIKRKSMLPKPNGALLDESEVTSSFDRFVV
jgi:hypothetical protein